MWKLSVHETTTGAPVLELPCSGAAWVRRLTGTGDGSHTIPLYGVDIPKALVREISRGHKYSVAQRWGSHVAFAGVITDRSFDESSQVLTVKSREFRSSRFGSWLTFGVVQYNPAAASVVISGKSHSGAVRATLEAALSPLSGWQAPLDLPADGAGSFSRVWRHEEALTLENMIAQIEADGCEVDLRPYIRESDGALRYEVRVAPQIKAGVPFDIAARAPGSLLVGLTVRDDFSQQLTGVLAFGNGTGQDRKYTFAPLTGSGESGIPIRDVKATFPDLYDDAALQGAANAMYLSQRDPVTQWSFGLHVWGVGPQVVDPGALMNMHVHGSKFLEDGLHPLRVVALAGDMSMTVNPEVQYAR